MSGASSISKRLFADGKGSSPPKAPIAFKSINVRRLTFRLWAWKVFSYIKWKRADIYKKQAPVGSMPIFARYSDTIIEQLFESSDFCSDIFNRIFSNEDVGSLDWDTVAFRIRAYEDEEGLPNILPFINTFSPSELTIPIFSTVSSNPFNIQINSLSDPKTQAAETVVQHDLPHEELDHVISTIQHGKFISKSTFTFAINSILR